MKWNETPRRTTTTIITHSLVCVHFHTQFLCHYHCVSFAISLSHERNATSINKYKLFMCVYVCSSIAIIVCINPICCCTQLQCTIRSPIPRCNGHESSNKYPTKKSTMKKKILIDFYIFQCELVVYFWIQPYGYRTIFVDIFSLYIQSNNVFYYMIVRSMRYTW